MYYWKFSEIRDATDPENLYAEKWAVPHMIKRESQEMEDSSVRL